MLLKVLLPFAMEVAPPGVVSEGEGGPRKRMYIAKLMMSMFRFSVARGLSLPVTSFGTGSNWQDGLRSRSVGNNTFVMPSSTLYASPENSSSETFCAFQPLRAIRPSLGLVL